MVSLELFLAVTVLLAGNLVFGGAAVGLSFHVWWTRKHGSGVLSAELRGKYYALRGWK